MKPLTGPETQLLRDALVSAYPDTESLRQLLYFKLEVDLNNVAGNGTWPARIFSLIRDWAEPNNRTEELIRAARANNPGNTLLRDAAEKLLPPPAPTTPPPIPWPAACRLIDQQAIDEAAAEAATPNMRNMYERLGQVGLRHIIAGQDARRDLTDTILGLIEAAQDAPGMRFQLVRAKGGNGKSTFLMRLAYELAQRGEYVLLMREGATLDETDLRPACAAAARADRRVYLLLDNVYRNHSRLLSALDQATIPNLTIIATSRFSEAHGDAPQPGIDLSAEPTNLPSLNRAEVQRLITALQACGMLKAANPAAVLASTHHEDESLLVAVARLTRTGGMDTYVQSRLIEMNSRVDPRGLEPAEWTEFLQVYYAVALCHAWGAEVPQVVISALTEGRVRPRRVDALLCEGFAPTPTRNAQEYLHGTCGGTWRTDHELIAARIVHLLADAQQSPLDRFTWLITQLATLVDDSITAGPAASLAGVLLRRCADTPELLFPPAATAPGLDPLAPIQRSFTVPKTPLTPAHAQLSAALDNPTLSQLLSRLCQAASATDLAENYGAASVLLCRWDDALADLDRSLEMRPDDLDTLYKRGIIYNHMQRDAEALADYTRSLALRPDHPDTLTNRGLTYADMQRYEDALTDYTLSLELRPDHPTTLHNRGTTYARMQRYEEALADFTRSLELCPDDPDTLNNRGNTYARMQRYEEALADFTRSLEFRPDDPGTLNNRGLTYAYMQRYDEALTDYTRSLKLRPNNASTLYILACLHSLREERDAALATLARAIEGDAENSQLAQNDPDFAALRDDPAFRALVGLPPNPAV